MTPEERAEKLVAFLAAEQVEPAVYAVDIFGDGGFYGDDVTAFMLSFSKMFGVDLSEFRRYFHTGEEGWNVPGGMFFKPPHMRVEHIAVTFDTLLRAAETGTWPVEYPPHAIPKHRWDIFINQIVMAMVAVCLLAAWVPFRNAIRAFVQSLNAG